VISLWGYRGVRCGDTGRELTRRVLEPMPETAPVEEPAHVPEQEPEAVPA
jgi:hypothetical protein